MSGSPKWCDYIYVFGIHSLMALKNNVGWKILGFEKGEARTKLKI
jgi:hypothetical protein